MKKIMNNMSRRGLCAMLAAMLIVLIAPAALAAVPDRPANKYVLDSAGVLSRDTEEDIIEENRELFEDYGAEIVVAAVDFLGGEDIEDYTYDMFNSWEIGSAERNNGLLLVLAIGEDNYYLQAGYGIDGYFDAARLSRLLDRYLEPDFAAGRYDEGVEKIFEALADEVEDYYENGEGQNDPMPDNDDDYGDYYEDSRHEERGFSLSSLANFIASIVRIILVVLIVIVLIGFFSSWFGGRGNGGGTGGGGGGGFWRGMMLGSMMNRNRRRWGAPPPPPPPGPMGGPGFGAPPRGPRPGGFGGFGGSGGHRGGFSGGGRSGFGGGAGRSGGGGGFHGGGGSHGGGAGRH